LKGVWRAFCKPIAIMQSESDILIRGIKARAGKTRGKKAKNRPKDEKKIASSPFKDLKKPKKSK
jgi:hypothetical protein